MWFITETTLFTIKQSTVLLKTKLFLVLFFIGGHWNAMQAQVELHSLLDSEGKKPSLEALKANKDILWIGELYVDYYPDYTRTGMKFANAPETPTYIDPDKNDSKLLKMMTRRRWEATNENDHLSNYLAHALINTKRAVTADEDLQQVLSEDQRMELARVEVVEITFDKETYAEEVRTVVRSEAESYQGVRIKQHLYYDQRKMAFEVVVRAMGPLIIELNSKGEVAATKVAYWTEPVHLKKRPDMEHYDIMFAKRLYKTVNMTSAKVVKATKPLAAVLAQSIVDFERHEENLRITGPSYLESDETLYDYSWESLDVEGVQELLLIQEFYWDASTRAMGVYQVGFGYVDPIAEEKGGTYFIRLPRQDRLEGQD